MVPLGEELGEELGEDLGEELETQLECLSCHEHHPNDRPCQLRVVEEDGEPAASVSHLDPISQSCMCCHPEAAKFKVGQKHLRHPVGIQATIRRQREEPLPLVDIYGTADAGDDVIACTTCHYAHTGPNPDILRWEPEKQGEACSVCHDRGGAGGTQPASGRRLSEDLANDSANRLRPGAGAPAKAPRSDTAWGRTLARSLR